MNTSRHILSLLFLLLVLPLRAQQDMSEQMKNYAEEYSQCKESGKRLQLANKFFSYLLEADYIDEPIQFPAGSHIDSVDVNVYYYVAEWHYNEGNYQTAADYCLQATRCMGEVDDASKSDVYGLLGAVYFRMSAYEKAVEALNRCYELDKKANDFDRMSSTLNSIASVFVASGKSQEAEKYVLEAIAANSLTNNITRRAVLFGTASELYRSLDEKDEALEYAQKALEAERMVGDNAKIGVRLSQLASAQMGLSKFKEARQSLFEAIPLLYNSGNLHSWGICKNQLGDILANEGKNDEAAACYLDAAMLFLKQGDMYNELHARKGLYKTTKESAPNEAMMHLERAQQLKDSIYQNTTSEAIAKYNALYGNDILQKENARMEQRNRTFLTTLVASFALLLILFSLAYFSNNQRHKRKEQNYEEHINTIEGKYSRIHKGYKHMMREKLLNVNNLSEKDRKFLLELADCTSKEVEKGNTDIKSIAKEMRVSVATIRRRVGESLKTTPKVFILDIRMDKAKNLLINAPSLSVAEVAEKCGYTQISNFTRAFKNYFDLMPSDLRAKYETDDDQQQSTL